MIGFRIVIFGICIADVELWECRIGVFAEMLVLLLLDIGKSDKRSFSAQNIFGSDQF